MSINSKNCKKYLKFNRVFAQNQEHVRRATLLRRRSEEKKKKKKANKKVSKML